MPLGYGQIDREATGDTTPAISPTCAKCGYDLRGATSNRCPECGHITLRKEAAQRLAQAKRAIAEYKEALEWSRRGMIVGAVGLAAAGWGLLFPSGWLQPVLRFTSVVAGASAFFLGLSVLRAGTHPQLIPTDDEQPLSHTSSVLAVVFGMADCLCAVFGPW